MKKSVLTAIVLAFLMSIGTAAQADTLFGATYDNSKTADQAVGNAAPTAGGLSTISNSSQFGAGSLNTSTSASGGNGTTYATAGNFNPQAGTVDFWMQMPNGYNGARQDLFGIFAGGYTGDFSLHLNPATDRLHTVVDVAGANQWSQGGWASVNNVLGDGNWHHIAWEWDSAANFATLYVDGTPENYTAVGTVSFDGGTLGSNFEVGSHQGGWDAFQGNIDDLRISGTAIYGQAGFTPPTRSTVPEPASMVMLLAGSALLLLRRRGM